MHIRLVSLLHCRSLRYLYTNRLIGTIPPQLAKLTNLTELCAQNRIAFHCIISDLLLYYLWPDAVKICVHLLLVWLLHCRSLRSLSSNQLNGTIPLQLGNLSQLQQLYASPFDAVYFLWFDMILYFWFDILFAKISGLTGCIISDLC